MQYAIHWFDPTPNLLSGIQPWFFIKRKLLHGDSKRGEVLSNSEIARVGAYWTPQLSVNVQDGPWSLTREGESVRVPIQAYRTEFYGPGGILQLGLVSGSAVLELFRKFNQEPVETLHIVIGRDCTPLPEHNAYRCYIGFSVETAIK